MYTDEEANIEHEAVPWSGLGEEHDLVHMKDEDEWDKDDLIMLIETLADVSNYRYHDLNVLVEYKRFENIVKVFT